MKLSSNQTITVLKTKLGLIHVAYNIFKDQEREITTVKLFDSLKAIPGHKIGKFQFGSSKFHIELQSKNKEVTSKTR